VALKPNDDANLWIGYLEFVGFVFEFYMNTIRSEDADPYPGKQAAWFLQECQIPSQKSE
jgi:hypothetical protein